MGRGFSAAESSSSASRFVQPLTASIGPRLFSRGKPIYGIGVWRVYRASIGPRLFSRGKHDNRAVFVGHGPLQLGRGFSAAESIPSPHTVSKPKAASIGPRLFSRGKLPEAVLMVVSVGLQLGRGFSAAESVNTVACLLRYGMLQLGRGFSAAESPRSRSRFSGRTVLQLGRGFSAAERRTGLSQGNKEYEASIGPRLFSRGKLPRPVKH